MRQRRAAARWCDRLAREDEKKGCREEFTVVFENSWESFFRLIFPRVNQVRFGVTQHQRIAGFPGEPGLLNVVLYRCVICAVIAIRSSQGAAHLLMMNAGVPRQS